jgi:hypothetical protein
MDDSSRLVLEYPELARRADAVVSQLASSEDFRNAFVADPTSALMSTAFAEVDIPEQATLDRANRLLYRLLSNRDFMAWAVQRQRELVEEINAVPRGEGEAGRQRMLWDQASRVELQREALNAIARYVPAEVIAEELGVESVDSVALEEQPSDRIVLSTRASSVNTVTNSNFTVTVTVVLGLLFVVITAFDMTPYAPEVGISRADIQSVARFMEAQFVPEMRQRGSRLQEGE